MEFIRTWILASKLAQLLIRTGRKWQRDQCLEMGAALSYYALFSLFPIFLVILSVIGFFLGPDTDTVGDILEYARHFLPPSAYGIVQDALFHLNHSSVGAGITGFFLLLFAASNVFEALDRAVDKIWQVHDRPERSSTVKSMAITFLKQKLFAFSLVLSAAILMLLTLSVSFALKLVEQALISASPLSQYIITIIQLSDVAILKTIQVGITFFVLNFIVMILFKVLPSTRVRWSDIWLGALITTTLLTLLQNLVSNSVIQIGSQYRSYGLIGGVMVLLLWIYFTCQIFFIGSEFTYVYAHLFGSRRDRQVR